MMAATRFHDPIEPMDLANMRANGVRSLDIQCYQCLHQVILNVDHLPGDIHGAVIRAPHSVHQVRDDRRRCAAELAGEAAIRTAQLPPSERRYRPAPA